MEPPMPTVELIYDRDCPHVAETRARLQVAFSQAGVVPRWREHLANDPSTPPHARGFGSPTILVAGRDIAGASLGTAPHCRLYQDEAGRPCGVPTVQAIADALALAMEQEGASRSSAHWGSGFAILPAIGAAFLPKVACPACWPAYAGFLGALGLGFLMDTAVLLPLTAVFLGLALGALAFRARRRRGYRPLALGTVAAAIVMIGKFGFESDSAMYAGLGLLVAASLWNSWPRPRKAACPACKTSG
jgi:hypothetical protein